MLRQAFLGAALLASCLGSQAQKRIVPPSGGKPISNQLIGIFFEDISMAADGGLYAELVQNGSFEYNPAEQDGWGPSTAWRWLRPGHSLGYMEIRKDNPIHPNNPTYMRLHVERVGHYYDFDGWTGVGLGNDGFDGISLKAGAAYDFSVFLRNVKGAPKNIRVALVSPKTGKVVAEASVVADADTWTKKEVALTAAEDCPDAQLRILVLDVGEVDVDMVSLMPQATFKGHGLRNDLAEALQALHPKFMRFPGGCVVHGGGDGFWDTYRWKTTIGPKEQRRGLKNTWGYHQSMGLGYYEYFQFCEDLGMQPLPVLPCGVNCQGSNGGWGMKEQAQDAVPMSEMDEWVQDALDLIEWANGPATSRWGAVRAQQGHPKPFGLKYLGIGNEERITPEFAERFRYMYKKITEAHPEIVVVGTAGTCSHPGGTDYEAGWRLAEELGVPLLDEHYYEPREYFIDSDQYDAYPRNRKTKVYLGEYASRGKTLQDALAEALYLLHVERNADVVSMTSFAPLFSRKGCNTWNPNLIYFDNERPYLTCNYYVQQMFGQSSGNYFYGGCVKIDGMDKLQDQSVVLNTATRTLFVKVCNASADTKKAQLDLSRFSQLAKTAEKTTLSGDADDENGFEQQPIAPVVTHVKIKNRMEMELAPHSFTMLKIKVGK